MEPHVRRTGVAPVALVGPPTPLAVDVDARVVAEIRCAEHEELETIRPCFEAAPHAGRHAYCVPLRDVDDVVVELHPAAAADEDENFLLDRVRVADREPVTGRQRLVAESSLLELERLCRRPELDARWAAQDRTDVLESLDVLERERHCAPPRLDKPQILDDGLRLTQFDPSTE